jgi:ABC-type glycerol-3-phosphate transport system substrate-binding protein
MTYLRNFLLALIISIAFANCSQVENTATKQEHLSIGAWPEIKKEHKPWTRWWWMGSAVDKENIALLLERYAEVGIGGVEIENFDHSCEDI